MRNPALEWDDDDGQVTLHLRRPQNWKTKLVGLLVPLPSERDIALDAIGGDVWRMCDGQTTIRAIASRLSDKYQLAPREAEISVGQFFKDLGRRGFVAFAKENVTTTGAEGDN